MKTFFSLCLLAALMGTLPFAATQCTNDPPQRPTAPFFATVSNTYSMFPVLKGGEKVLVAPVTKEQIRTGMVLVYWVEGSGMLVIHRVHRMTPVLLYMRGDWNTAEDRAITYDQVVGYWLDPDDEGTWLKNFATPAP